MTGRTSASPVSVHQTMLGPVCSAIHLPALGAGELLVSSWSVAYEEGASTAVSPSDPPAVTPSDPPAVRRRGDVAELEFPGVALVLVDLTRRVIDIRAEPGTDVAELASLVVDHVIPQVAADTSLVLHAAGVVVDDDGATLVVGPGGAGKSTLATRWCLHGGQLLGDDTVRVEGTTAFPSYVGPRLWPSSLEALGMSRNEGRAVSSVTEKRRLGPEDGIVLAEEAAQVTRIVVIEPTPTRRGRVTAVRVLFEQALNLGAFDPVALLDRVTALVGGVPEVEVRPPWEAGLP